MTAEYAQFGTTPEGRARLDKYGSTLDASNVRRLCERIADYPEVLAAAGALLSDADVLREVQWRLDHYGPRDAEPFQYSRFESPAHAALSVIYERLGVPIPPGATGGEG